MKKQIGLTDTNSSLVIARGKGVEVGGHGLRGVSGDGKRPGFGCMMQCADDVLSCTLETCMDL